MAHSYKSLGTAGLSITLIVLWVLGWMITPEGEGDPLSMSASNIILVHIRPWVYLTSGFYNPSIVQLIPIVLATIVLGMRVEAELGTAVMLRMIFFANILTSVLIFCNIFVLYIIFRVPSLLYTHIASFSGGVQCLLVAWIQANPGQRLGGVRLALFPLLVCSILSAITVLGCHSAVVLSVFLSSVPYSLGGWYFGWYYLRFLTKRPDGSIGDKSDDFALHAFFPVALKACISPLANFSLNVVQLCGFLKAWSRADLYLLPVTSSDAVSERRRARAKKALDSKLAMLVAAPPPEPVVVQEEEDKEQGL